MRLPVSTIETIEDTLRKPSGFVLLLSSRTHHIQTVWKANVHRLVVGSNMRIRNQSLIAFDNGSVLKLKTISSATTDSLGGHRANVIFLIDANLKDQTDFRQRCPTLIARADIFDIVTTR